MMLWSSVRFRLALWNMAMLALVLTGFGLTISYTVQANQGHAIDRDLARRARPVKDGRWPVTRRFVLRRSVDGSPNTSPAPPHRSDSEPGQRAREGRLLFKQLPPVPPEGRALTSGRGPSDDAATDPDFARPLVFDLEGEPLGPRDDRPWDHVAFRAAAAGEERYSTVTYAGERLRVLSVPLRLDGVLNGVVQFAHPLGEQQRLAESLFRTLLAAMPLALLTAGLGGLLLTSRALRPVRRVTQAAAQIGAEDLSQRLEVTGKDELSELAATFNGMIGRLEGAFAGLSDAYRKLEVAYEDQRRFTADASHELRTPLTRIKGMTSLALSGPHCADEYREALTVADQAADAMGRIVQDLLLLARADSGQLGLRSAPVQVEWLLEEALRRVAAGGAVDVRLEPPGVPLAVCGDADHLVRLLVNLLENALRHTPCTGEVKVAAHSHGEWVVLQVSDTGEGIAPEHLPHLCERFYRVDAARARVDGGTGLGLAICQSIVRAHHGELAIRSQPGSGTTVEVRLPVLRTYLPEVKGS